MIKLPTLRNTGLVLGLLLVLSVSSQAIAQGNPAANLEGTSATNDLAHFSLTLPTGLEAVERGVLDDYLRDLAEKKLINAWRHESPKRQKELIAGLTDRDINEARQRYSFAYAPDGEMTTGAPMILGVHYEAKLTEVQILQLKGGAVDSTPLFKNNIPGRLGMVRGKYIEKEARFEYVFSTFVDDIRVRGVGALIRTTYGFVFINLFFGVPEYSSGLELDEAKARKYLAAIKIAPEYSFQGEQLGFLAKLSQMIGFRIHFGVSDPKLGINPTFVLLSMIAFAFLGWFYKNNIAD